VYNKVAAESSLMTDAHAYVQRLVSVVKLATSGVCYERPMFCYAFLLSKGINTKDIHKEMFPVYGGKYFSHKAVHNCF
jgi:hypothetical protein